MVKSSESSLLETEFELKEVEISKQVRSEDARLQEILQELKRKCKGYYGQVYELVKPIHKKYDVSVKIGLCKTLRYLVVDTVSSSQYCTEFLKEKGLRKDVLVLENIPEYRRKEGSITAEQLKRYEAEFLSNVVDVTRKGDGKVQEAINFFVKDKLVCKDFDMAMKLQRELKC